MAKYGRKASEKVARTMHEMREGKLRSGGSGRKVTNPKQAVAIGLSEARQSGAKVPSKKAGKAGGRKTAGRKTADRKVAGRKTTGRKPAGRKTAGRKTAARKTAARSRAR